MRIWTDEMLKFLKNKCHMKNPKESAVLVNKKFKTKITEKQVVFARQRYKIHSNAPSGFKKGYTPWNKGKSYCAGGNSVRTQFKKGNRPHNTMPIGAERTDKENYLYVKVKEPDVWECKHRIIYEKHFGKIPDNSVVIFADQNKRNFDPDNLILVTRAELARMNKNGWIYEEPELTKTGAVIAKLSTEIGKQRHGRTNQNK